MNPRSTPTVDAAEAWKAVGVGQRLGQTRRDQGRRDACRGRCRRWCALQPGQKSDDLRLSDEAGSSAVRTVSSDRWWLRNHGVVATPGPRRSPPHKCAVLRSHRTEASPPLVGSVHRGTTSTSSCSRRSTKPTCATGLGKRSCSSAKVSGSGLGVLYHCSPQGGQHLLLLYLISLYGQCPALDFLAILFNYVAKQYFFGSPIY